MLMMRFGGVVLACLVAAGCGEGGGGGEPDGGASEGDAGGLGQDASGLRAPVIDPSAFDFGTVTIGATSDEQRFTVRNRGRVATGALAVETRSPDAGAFPLSSDGCTGATLEPGETCELTVQFAPESTGEKTTLLVAEDETTSTSAELTGAGISTYELTVTVQTFSDASGTVVSNPTGITCGEDCSEAYDVGTTVTLTPISGPQSEFFGWGGDCSGTGTCEVVMDADRSVSAAFGQSPCPKKPCQL